MRRKQNHHSFKQPLPKGFGSQKSGGKIAEVEKMIGRRVEDMTAIITASFIAAWLATLAGTTVGYVYYPWAYPMPSATFAFGGLTVFEAIGYLFCVKVSEEGTSKNSNGVLAVVLGSVAFLTVLFAIFPPGVILM